MTNNSTATNMAKTILEVVRFDKMDATTATVTINIVNIT